MARPVSSGEIGSYLNRVRSYPVLSREEEFELVTRWIATKDPAARERLLAAHLRYVVAIALRYRRYSVPVEELVSEGNFGLVHALGKFEPGRGTRFVTYAAYWIRAYVLNHVIRSWRLVGVGSGALRSKMFFRLRRERVKIANLVGEGPDADTIVLVLFADDYQYDDLAGEQHESTTITAEKKLTRDVRDFLVQARSKNLP